MQTLLSASRTSACPLQHQHSASTEACIDQCTLAPQVYSQIYNTSVAGNGGATALNYTSPNLHTVVLNNLQPGTKYFYQVGDGTTYSGTYNFTALADPSESPIQ